MDDHTHYYTITDALDDIRTGDNWKRLRIRGSQTDNVQSASSSVAASIPTPRLSVYDAFDGSSTYPKTATLALTTKSATTLTTSGMIISKPMTTEVATDKRGPPYPANGCWQDPKATDCPYIRPHTQATLTPTAPASNPHTQHVANNFLRKGAPYFGAGIGAAILILVMILVALRYRAKSQLKRKNAAKDRQSKRMSDGEEGSKPENGGASIELRPMRRDGKMPQPTRVYSDGWFGGRSELPTPAGRDSERDVNPWERT
ncbi:MAG: hypothetical protein Q9182_004181 [Xanthomendoza sp. 2 TL-2023]